MKLPKTLIRRQDRVERLLPSERFCERLNLEYELHGCLEAVRTCGSYYHIKNMWIVVDGRNVFYYAEALYGYEIYTASFRRRGINKHNVYHEFFHHLMNCCGYEFDAERQEVEADQYASKVISRR
jgi:hypothetical protein